MRTRIVSIGLGLSLTAAGLLSGSDVLAAPALSSPVYQICKATDGKLSVRNKCPRAMTKIKNLGSLLGGTLPSAVTLRGFYEVDTYTIGPGPDSVYHGTISFGSSVASAPTAHYIASGQSAPAECPGSVEQPEAQPGHLCLYENGRLHVDQATVATTAGDNYQATFGAIVSVTPSLGSGHMELHGTWAVTAP